MKPSAYATSRYRIAIAESRRPIPHSLQNEQGQQVQMRARRWARESGTCKPREGCREERRTGSADKQEVREAAIPTAATGSTSLGK